jgi:hypothetical protein
MNMQNSTQGAFSILATCALILVTCGCEPQLEVFSSPSPASDDLIVTDLREMPLNWPYHGNRLGVSKPPRFEFLNSLTGLQRSWYPPRSESTDSPTSSWSVPPNILPEREQDTLRRALGEIKSDVRPIFEASCSPSNDNRFYDISSNGRWLACANSQVQLWDVQSGRLAHEFKPNGSAVISCLRFTSDNKHLLVATGQRLAQYDLESKTLVNEVPLPADAQAIVVAMMSDWVIVTMTNNRALAMKSDLSNQSVLTEHIPSNYPTPALSPSGRMLAFWTDQGGVAVTLADGNVINRIEHSFSEWEDAPTDEVRMGINCGDRTAYWLAKDRAYTFHFADSQHRVREFHWPLLAFAPNALDGAMVGLFARPAIKSHPATMACIDLVLYPPVTASIPSAMPMTTASSLRSDSSGSFLACQVGEKIHVFQRNRWVTGDTNILENLLLNWIRNGICQRIDTVAPMLRNIPEMRVNRSGEQLHDLLIQWIARLRLYPEIHTISPEAIAKLDEWLASDSESAQLASVCVDAVKASDLHYRLLQGEAGQNEMDEMVRLRQSVTERINKILAAPNPSLAAFHIKAKTLIPGEISVEDGTPFIQEVVRRFPLDYAVHGTIIDWLTPYAAGNKGDDTAYALALANAIGGEQGERMYAELAVNIIFRADGQPGSTSLRNDVLTRGVLVGLKENYWSNRELISLARALGGEGMSNPTPTCLLLMEELKYRLPVTPPELTTFSPAKLSPRY